MRRAILLLLSLSTAAAARDFSGVRAREIDALKLVVPKKHAVLGTWSVENGALIAALGEQQPFRIEIPYAPGDEYDLRVTVERKEGNPPFVVGLPVGDRQISVDFDGWGGSDTCGISMIDNKSGEGNDSKRVGKLLTNNRPSLIVCSVRRGGVAVTVDGLQVINWKGERTRLSLWGGWKMPRTTTPFLATWGGRFVVTRIGLVPVTGTGREMR